MYMSAVENYISEWLVGIKVAKYLIFVSVQ